MGGPWQDAVRRGLVSDDARLRLHTYSTLSTKCSESKEMQKQVGQLFGSPRTGIVSHFAGSSLLSILFDDLHSTDRTLRIAAARVLCLMAYENLTNQQLIIQSQVEGDEEQVGVNVGWVYAFSIPQSLRDRYEAQCEERGEFTTPSGLVEFVSNLIKDNYAPVYNRIGRYYAGGCQEFLPLCWSHGLANDSPEATDMTDVPDPNENLVGFYLIPRQMQFPEQDDFFVQEILTSIRTEDELSCLQQVYAAYQQVAYRVKEASAAALKIALEGIHNQLSTSLVNEEESIIAKQRHSNVLRWLNASSERMITWNELLLWCCTDMNANEMLKRFGIDAYRTLGVAFRKLTLGSDGVQTQKDETTSFVWESALVGVVLNHPDVPDGLKTNLRTLASGYVNRFEVFQRKIERNTAVPGKKPADSLTDSVFERPWEYLLPLELTEIHPISWSVFLSKWRQSADSKPGDDENMQTYQQIGRRHHSIGGAKPSLLDVRKNALVTLGNHRIFHSFRDLNQLRQQLPLITNRPPDVKEDAELEFSSTSRSLKCCHQLSEAEERELEENRKLFRRLQQSSRNLDEVTRQRVEEKREARSKAHEKAAENRKKGEQLAAQRQHELERANRDKHAKVQERLRSKEYRWQLLLEVRQERHQRAQWWQHIQHEAAVARQDEFYQQQQEQIVETARRLEKNQHDAAYNQRMSTISLHQRPPASPRQVPCPRRPMSARSSTDPHIVRERANVYGCAATKAFAARRPQTCRGNFCSGTPNSRGRHHSRRVRPASASSSGESRNETFNASSTTDSTAKDPQVPTVAIGNACETLVMTNASHAIAQQIAIPPVVGPVSEEEVVSPAVIMAQYLALEKEQRFKLHERYCGNRCKP